MHILVVDDSSTMRRILTRVLARMGFPKTSEAANGKDALARMTASPVDLVIVDWNMPGMSGPELTRAIRSSPATRDIPVLMVTANATSDEVQYARLAGVSGYVVKPFSGETLKQQIASVLRPPAAPDQPGPVR
jgi:two-component system chemotaxis response regulator CheY